MVSPGAMLTETFKLILRLDRAKPAPSLPARLDRLFRDLAMAKPERPVAEIEDAIWALWTSHEDPTAAASMERAIAMIGAKKSDAAERLLTDMVEAHPAWPEAWNKRATLHYLVGRDADSVADIRRTLELEPRHFGAVCGFAQICLRNGDTQKAIAAFDAALLINPHMDQVRTIVRHLSGNMPRTVN
jgi:predicted Zn-dependent protease